MERNAKLNKYDENFSSALTLLHTTHSFVLKLYFIYLIVDELIKCPLYNSIFMQ
jgi:hypothetical protein